MEEAIFTSHPHKANEIRQYCQNYPDDLDLLALPIVLEGGEFIKNQPSALEKILHALREYNLCRHSHVIAIGGGAFIDTISYAAALVHRGIRCVRIPTSVLSQLDSAVGVKNGVNRFGQKNFLGTFTPPFAVLIDFDFLSTLEDRDWRSGISEAIKVALLKDAAFFDYLETQANEIVKRNLTVMKKVITSCAKMHLEHIAGQGDPFEFGSARPLDFGHWSAHKLEQVSQNELHHGEAVAIGIALDSTYSYLSGLLSEAHWQRIIKIFDQLQLAVYSPYLEGQHDDLGNPNILSGLEEFRRHLGGPLAIYLLKEIGQAVLVNSIDHDKMKQSIQILKEISLTPNRKDPQTWKPMPNPAP